MFLKQTFGFSLLMALGTAMAPAYAQQIYRGTVNLPVEANWSGVILQPGLHKIVIENGFNGVPLIHISGEGREQSTILAGPFQSKPVSGHGALKLVDAGGTMAVKQLDAGAIGKTFDFILPKAERGKTERASTASETIVAITSTR